MSKRRPRFTDEDRFRIRIAKVDLAIALDNWEGGRSEPATVVNAVEQLMLAAKILKPSAADGEVKHE